MQLWRHSMKTSLHYHIRVYIHVLMLLQRWFSAFGEISIAAIHTLLTLTPAVSAHTAGKLTVVRERGSEFRHGPHINRKTFTIRAGMINEICAQRQVMMMMKTRSFAKTKLEPSHPMFNFNQFQLTSWVSEWVISMAERLPFHFLWLLGTFLR